MPTTLAHVYVEPQEAREIYKEQNFGDLRYAHVSEETLDELTPATPVGTLEYAEYSEALRAELAIWKWDI